MGALSDRFGRKPLLFVSLLGSCVGYLVMALAQSTEMLMIARLSVVRCQSNRPAMPFTARCRYAIRSIAPHAGESSPLTASTPVAPARSTRRASLLPPLLRFRRGLWGYRSRRLLPQPYARNYPAHPPV
ncbi:MAG: hypothetical protein ACK4JD_09520 [Thermoflexales bacterium]